MEQGKRKSLKDFKITFNPNDNTFLSSLLGDGQGNYNLFRMIVDPQAPEISQRIYTNDYRNNN
jgi:hypothetical protein